MVNAPLTAQAATNLPAIQASPTESPSDTRVQCLAKAALPVKLAIGIIAPLTAGLAALGGMASFATIRDLAIPWFGAMAWTVPVGIDTGILALLASDLLIEYLDLPWPALRWTAWAFVAATVYLNIAGAHGNQTAAVMHAAMPVLFVTVIEGARHLIRQLTGLTTGTRTERIPAARWLLAPWSSFQLTRRMILWQVTSYRHALELEHRRLQAIARLQETYGQYKWRWKASIAERLELRLPPDAVPAPSAGKHHSADVLEDSTAPGPSPDERDRQLVRKAREILQDSERQGARLGQIALAKRLRAEGHAIANDRLAWLMTVINSSNDLPA
jgi:hypothetical protein